MDWSVIRASVAENWNDSAFWRGVALPFVVNTALIEPYFAHVNPQAGVDMMAEDWDNLVILDACRYDLFTARNTIDGDLQTRRSPGSNTAEFLQETFAGESFPDTVYVTANPQVSVRLDDPFHRTIPVWRDGWDEELNTVPPGTMVEATRAAHEEYPDKRIVSHWVQPHYPFIGERGRELLGRQAGIELSKRMADDTDADATSDHHTAWDMLRRDTASLGAVKTAYAENLDLALPHVAELLDDLDGRSVVTADHGNLLGERPSPCPVPFKLYGHPPGVHADALVTVPWLVVEGESRREVVAEKPESDVESDRDDGSKSAEQATERLEHLGYVE